MCGLMSANAHNSVGGRRKTRGYIKKNGTVYVEGKCGKVGETSIVPVFCFGNNFEVKIMCSQYDPDAFIEYTCGLH